MENATWNGLRLIASEVADDYKYEKQVRLASSSGYLRCPDVGCEHPIVKYCHGNVKEPYFAHLEGAECDYVKYENDKGVFRNLKHLLYKHFKNNGYDVSLEVKTLQHHYSDLLFKWPDGSMTALELGTKRTTAKEVNELEMEYKKANISFVWIVVDNTCYITSENQTFFLNRYGLNENNDGNLIIISLNGTCVSHYKMDLKHNWKNSSPIPFCVNALFVRDTCIEELIWDNGVLTTNGFQKQFADFVEQNQQKVSSHLEEKRKIEEENRKVQEERRRKEEERKINQEQERIRKQEERRKRIEAELPEYVLMRRDYKSLVFYMEAHPKVSRLNDFLKKLISFSGIFYRMRLDALEEQIKVSINIKEVNYNTEFDRFEIQGEDGKIYFFYLKMTLEERDLPKHSNPYARLNIMRLDEDMIEEHMRKSYRCVSRKTYTVINKN